MGQRETGVCSVLGASSSSLSLLLSLSTTRDDEDDDDDDDEGEKARAGGSAALGTKTLYMSKGIFEDAETLPTKDAT